jgi:periplasmic copper chaperone A
MQSIRILVPVAFVLSTAGVAAAHVSVSSGPAAANKSQKISFGVGHGCEGADTVKVRVTIPTGLTGVRVLRSDFGKATVERDAADAVTAVTWEKPAAELLDEDYGYYDLTIRARTPDAPFTKLTFVVTQTCRTAGGVETVVMWDGVENEAPELVVTPAHQSGWNRYTVAAAVAEEDLPTYLGDALIAWRGTAAYTSNPNTLAQIQATAGVTVLTGGLAANDEIWVKY